jgi:hypothetical protein
MKAIADALVYAVTYINLQEGKTGLCDDGNVGALESIAGFLYSATEEEKDALAAAAERALASELNYVPRKEFVEDYTTWMHDMFGEGWVGNKRAQ